jgi:uncharacterized cupredoxin-like copper-binding protein
MAVKTASMTLAAGMFAAAVLGACSPARAAHETIAITINHSRFTPAVFQVSAGTTVTFVVRNDDPIAHELIVGNEVVQAVHETGSERHHGAKPGEISIPSDEERSTTYEFDQPGRVLLGCHLPGHYDYGMRGHVDVMP